MSSISSIGGSSAVSAPSCESSGLASSAQASAPQDTTQVSSRGKLMQELQQLQQTDPDKFKAVMAEVAQKLGAAADQASSAADGLRKMAADFSQAAQTGQMPQRPSGASGHHHGHHHHAAVQAYSGASSSSSSSGSSQSSGVDLSAVLSQALQDNGVSAAS
jgi:hypothetical protein